MGSIKLPGNLSPKGLVLAVNTGSITTKYAVYRDGEIILDRKLEHSVQELSRFADVMDQEGMRTEAILDALKENGIELEDIDIVMARGGLFTPCLTGVYNVNDDMREVLKSSRDGNHACNLSALIDRKSRYPADKLIRRIPIPQR